MKSFVLGLMCSVFITGCCCTKKDMSLKDISDYPDSFKKEVGPPKGYENNYVACRASDPGRVESIVSAAVNAKNDGKKVLFYFHGGLSGQKYMLEDLGPALIGSVFENGPYKGKLHPIFMNYDAHLKDNFKDDPDIKKLYLIAKRLFGKTDKLTAANTSFEVLIRDLDQALSTKELLSNKSQFKNESLQFEPAILLSSFKKRANDKSGIGDEIENLSVEYLSSLLEEDKLPSDFDIDEVVLNKLANDFKSVVDTNRNKEEEKALIDLFPIDMAALRIIRILTRMALKIDHGTVATVQEEVLDAFLGASKLGVMHWDMVKRHSKECFAEGSNGREIVKGLLAEGIKINTLSHSAGSIPTAELINYLSTDYENYKLDEVVMLVPAINQMVFNEYVLKNKDSFNQMNLYVLKEEKERKDKVGASVIYSSSLLYAVSSLAEGQVNFDQMLMIHQHLKSDRPPYNNDKYLKAWCESPKDIWEEIAKKEKVKVEYYPFYSSPKSVKATHGGTKHPWESPDLACRYLKNITGEDVEPSLCTFKKQKVNGIESQFGEKDSSI